MTECRRPSDHEPFVSVVNTMSGDCKTSCLYRRPSPCFRFEMGMGKIDECITRTRSDGRLYVTKVMAFHSNDHPSFVSSSSVLPFSRHSPFTFQLGPSFAREPAMGWTTMCDESDSNLFLLSVEIRFITFASTVLEIFTDRRIP